MATKRSALPPITQHEITHAIGRLRRTPNGGHAWKCHYCGEYASSQTQQGVYVCRRHGGVTPKQRNGTATPPGRPISTGQHSRSPRLSIDELVEQYEDSLEDATATDEHMIYLRSLLYITSSKRPDEDLVEATLCSLSTDSQQLGEFLQREASANSRGGAESCIYRLSLFGTTLFSAKQTYEEFLKATTAIEKRHARLIHLTKARAQTRERYAEHHHLRELTRAIPTIVNLIESRVGPATVQELQLRLAQEFTSLPARALQRNTITIDTAAINPEDFANRGTMVDKVAARFVAMGDEPEHPRRDMHYLKAYVRSLTTLHESVSVTRGHLETTSRHLKKFLDSYGFRKDGEPAAAREVLSEYRFGRQLNRIETAIMHFVDRLKSFESELEDRHAQIIELATTVMQIELGQASKTRLDLKLYLARKLLNVLSEVLSPPDIQYLRPHVPLLCQDCPELATQILVPAAVPASNLLQSPPLSSSSAPMYLHSDALE